MLRLCTVGFGQVGIRQAAIVLVVLLLLFGSKRVPALARSVGTAWRDLRRALSGLPPSGPDEPGKRSDRD